MEVLCNVIPILVMIGLGKLCRAKKWFKEEECNGLNRFVFGILFPIMIFNLCFSAKFERSHFLVVVVIFIIYVLGIFLGILMDKLHKGEFSNLYKYMISTNEGGSVALPLYLSIVGMSSNTVLFDLAGTFIAFLIYPIMVQKSVSGESDIKGILKSLLSNSFVIAVILGLGCNALGLYQYTGELYSSIMSMITSPIGGSILFMLGFNMNFEKSIIGPVLKMMVVKTLFYGVACVSFFIIFKGLMSDWEFVMAVLLSFMSPLGFAVSGVISPEYKSDRDRMFVSTYTSLYIIVTLIVYVVILLV